MRYFCLGTVLTANVVDLWDEALGEVAAKLGVAPRK